MFWKKLSSREVYKGKWMSVTEDDIENPSGKQFTWTVLRKAPFSLVIPWDGEKFVLVGVQRYASNRLSWEFPAGSVSGADTQETAKQELMEEAGVVASTVSSVGDVFISNGHSDQQAYFFLATGLTQGEQKLEGAEEGMQVGRFTYQEVCEKITDGTIKDMATVAGLGLLLANGWLKEQNLI